MIATYGFYFARPWWLLALLPVVPMVWIALRSMKTLGRTRRALAIVCRVLVCVLLAAAVSGPTVTQRGEKLTVIAVMDRSQSVPESLQAGARSFVSQALSGKQPDDRLAVVDIAEVASIAKLPSSEMLIRERNTVLVRDQSNLAAGVQMGMAIAPPDTAVRMLLVSDGNETEGDLRAAARIAAANRIPVDVLPLRYSHTREVILKRIAAPLKARSDQTITLRFILYSTDGARGKLLLTLNGRAVDLDPDSAAIAAAVELKPGTNVKAVSLPVGTRGTHEFEAVFVPDDPGQDSLSQNNRAGAVTVVAGPGYVLVADTDGAAARVILGALHRAGIEATYVHAGNLPRSLPKLLDIDAIVLADTDASNFSFDQQEMLCRYVTEMGGGLVMTGGPNSFGAGGWIGSPVAEILPVDLDPPQKKQMPKGALVLIMHACEMPRGNHWGKKVAIAAVQSLSRLDLVGVLDYAWNAGDSNWVFPLGPAGDKTKPIAAIRGMQMGDMPDFHAPMNAAYQKLKACDAAQKHMIIISDGDPSPPSKSLLTNLRKAGITCSGVAVYPHSPADVRSLQRIAQATGGRFYNVKDPSALPQIFVKEAQVVRRALIVEESFTPRVTWGLGELIKGVGGTIPKLDGYVLTGPKGGLAQVVMTGMEKDPLLATGQAGLGRCVAFTSSADSRWASQWLGWGGFDRFWEQAIRWASRPAHSADCDVYADVRGRNVTLTVEAAETKDGAFARLAGVTGQIIGPDMSTEPIELSQVGPGQYRAEFRAKRPGSHLVSVRYAKQGSEGKFGLAQSAVTVPYAPEFRDLSDNAALLSEVAQVTGGRVLGSDPNQADLFAREGVTFPETGTSLVKPLLLVGLALFLLDVAIRRIAVDFPALARRLLAVLPGTRRVQAVDTTLDRLRKRRDEVRHRLGKIGRSDVAQRRYETGGAAATGQVPIARVDTAPPKAPPQPSKDEPAAKPAKTAEEPTHLQRLLKAKRETRDRMDGSDPDTSGDR